MMLLYLRLMIVRIISINCNLSNRFISTTIIMIRSRSSSISIVSNSNIRIIGNRWQNVAEKAEKQSRKDILKEKANAEKLESTNTQKSRGAGRVEKQKQRSRKGREAEKQGSKRAGEAEKRERQRSRKSTEAGRQ